MANLMPSPVQWSPHVVGMCFRSGRCLWRMLSGSLSAPYPPVARTTGPYSQTFLPPTSSSSPFTLPLPSLSSLVIFALSMILALSGCFSATSSSASMRAKVIVIPGNFCPPRCVRGCECPPSRDTRERSRPKLSISHSTPGPDSQVRTFACSFDLAPPRMVSSSKTSGPSLTPLARCVRVPAPLMPEVALVEFPPINGFLSTSSTRDPRSIAVCAAESPANPPPTTITWSILIGLIDFL
mmetsp:Transcript_3363/g.7903  ORF Transcript_3363/g.7903 Transcript_3363/m.7903 type:complete len:239 (+) Transcript_3363:1830-2546(+)